MNPTETLSAPPEVTPAADAITTTLQRLAQFPVRSDAERQRARDEELQRAVAGLRMAWGAPDRHVMRQPQFSGPWAEKLEALWGRMRHGRGTMAALVGIRGNGKTQMAVELMRRITALGKPARFITAVGFFIKLKATFRREATQTEDDLLMEFARPQLLVIDEFEKRADSQWENNLVFELLNRRYNARRDTVLIANDSKKGFDDYAGASLVSRINETGGLVECTWPSFRD